jgi:hypothetical protein
VPGYLAGFLNAAARPGRFIHATDPLAGVLVHECADSRDDPGRVAAQHSHIGEGDIVAAAAEHVTQHLHLVSRDRGQDWLAVAQAIVNEGNNVFLVLLAAGVEQRQMDQAMVTWHSADRLIHNPTDASPIVRGASRSAPTLAFGDHALPD